MSKFRSKAGQYVNGGVATVRHSRSQFDLSHEVKTTFNVGELVPIDITEVLAGDTFKCDISQVVRISSAFLRPVMDNVFMDVYSFFVPLRILYDKFNEVMGENTKSAWIPTDIPSIPTLAAGTVSSRSVADYLGLPVGEIPKGVSVLPFRAFAEIYNEWFRNQNTVDPCYVNKGELSSTEVLNNDEWSPSNYTGKLPKVAKKKDYFTSALPTPQKGDAVTIGAAQGQVPVEGTITVPSSGVDFSVPDGNSGMPLRLFETGGDGVTQGAGYYTNIGIDAASQRGSAGVYMFDRVVGTRGGTIGSGEFETNPLYLRIAGTTRQSTLSRDDGFNLYLDGSALTATNVNDMRIAFQTQRMLERDARCGTRLREHYLAAFGVSNPDMRMQIPEFLGGARMPIQIQQVAQTNTQLEQSGSVESPLAALGAFSHSVGKSRYVKSFTEDGYVITVALVRTFHAYSQGISPMWRRKSRNDFYDPVFANVGEMPIYQSELYALGKSDLKDNVFGYKEAWAEYRFQPNRICGQLRPNVSDNLDVWHFGDNYANAPVLSEEFTNETAEWFDRTVAVPSTSQDNFIADFWFDLKAARVMPVYSIPGLIDHN